MILVSLLILFEVILFVVFLLLFFLARKPIINITPNECQITCENGGICVNNMCSCSASWTGSLCQTKKQNNGIIVIRHGAKSDIHCDLTCRTNIINELNCLNGFTDSSTYTDLNSLGIQQAYAFQDSIPQTLLKFNLKAINKTIITSYYQDGEQANGNANTYLTISPYLCSLDVDVELFKTSPILSKPIDGTTLIAGNASFLMGTNRTYPFSEGSALHQLIKLYDIPSMSVIERGVGIFVFMEQFHECQQTLSPTSLSC